MSGAVSFCFWKASIRNRDERKGGKMNEWDARIISHWSEELGVDAAVFEKRGVVARAGRDESESLKVYSIGGVQVVVVPTAFVSKLPDARELLPHVEALAARLNVTLTLTWRDFVYYATTPLDEVIEPERLRSLTPDDAPLLADLQGACTPDEVEISIISIDDLYPTGYFEGKRLVGVASVLDKGHEIEDIGVLTHPDYRGRGIGSTLTRYLRNHIAQRGNVAQYITMERNRGSVGIAEKCQFRRFVVEEGYSVAEAGCGNRLGLPLAV
jgi:ribosomal protein S18 acetylase RimI-like enzyme